MIGKLKGKVDSIFDEYLILDVNGVGYRVFCSSKTLSSVIIGAELALVIQTIVRDDAIMLFGFLSNNEKKWFEILCKVNGIGSKLALKIMGTLTTSEILTAIESGDAKMFCRAPGVGQKIASRILVELKDIRKNVNIVIDDAQFQQRAVSDNIKKDSRLQDALSALENLGYQKNVAYNIIVDILKDRETIVIESLITEALKRINNF
jgi:holliday junction DNA helicase RuvA